MPGNLFANNNELLNKVLDPSAEFGCGLSNVTVCDEFCDVGIADLYP